MKIAQITEADLEGLIEDEQFLVLGVLSICVLTLTNGFKVTGTSAPMDPDRYDEAIGQSIARKKAFDQLWQLEGFHRMSVAASQVNAD